MSKTCTNNLHTNCCTHCEACNPKEDRSAATLRQKFGKPLFELNDDPEANE